MSQDLLIGEKEYDFFENNSIVSILKACDEAGYSPLFMPEFARLRIAHPQLFKGRGRTMSIRATGKTTVGSAIDIYAHVPGEWSELQYISDMISRNKLINYALPLTQEAFDALEKRNGEIDDSGVQFVTVMDHAQAQKAKFGEQTLDQALENPHVQAFFGGEKLAREYLNAYKKVYGENIWFHHKDDLGESPVARPLVLNNSGLVGYYFNSDRRVPGVRASVASTSAQGAQRKKLSIDILLADSRAFISEDKFPSWEEFLRQNYQ